MKLIILNEEKIFKISSEFCLKTVFSYVDYKTTLKLIKNNKNLQNKLGIDLQNYKTESNYGYIERKVNIEERLGVDSGLDKFITFGITGCMSGIFLLFLLTYAILLVSINLFDETNTKENYDETYLDIIKKLISFYLYLLLFLLAIIFY